MPAGRALPRGARGRISATGQLLQVLGIPSPVRRDLRGGLFDLTEIIGRELDVHRADVFLETMQLRGARDRDDPRLLGKHPGQCDLSWCPVLPLCDPRQQIDEGPIRLPSLRREARDDVAEVGAVERGALVDLPRQEALAKWAEGDEADPELPERRQELCLW